MWPHFGLNNPLPWISSASLPGSFCQLAGGLKTRKLRLKFHVHKSRPTKRPIPRRVHHPHHVLERWLACPFVRLWHPSMGELWHYVEQRRSGVCPLWPLPQEGWRKESFHAKYFKQMQVKTADGTDNPGSLTPPDCQFWSGHHEQNSCFLAHYCTEQRMLF